MNILSYNIRGLGRGPLSETWLGNLNLIYSVFKKQRRNLLIRYLAKPCGVILMLLGSGILL